MRLCALHLEGYEVDCAATSITKNEAIVDLLHIILQAWTIDNLMPRQVNAYEQKVFAFFPYDVSGRKVSGCFSLGDHDCVLQGW